MMRNILLLIGVILLYPLAAIAQIPKGKIPNPDMVNNSSWQTKIVLIDFDCKINYMTFIPKDTLRVIDEVIAETDDNGTKKSISIINMIIPSSYWKKANNRRGKEYTKLLTFFIFPSAKKTGVTWYPINPQDPILKKTINSEQFAVENYMGNTGHFEVIIKRDGVYFVNDGYAVLENKPFDDYPTYYPSENEGINCRSRQFTKKEIEQEILNINSFRIQKKGIVSINSINLQTSYFANREDSLTNVVHLEHYIDYTDPNGISSIYDNWCGKNTIKGSRSEWILFSELDAHYFLGILGGNLFCFGSDGMLPEADRLSRRYYKFKSIGGFTDIRQYYQYYLELGAGRIPRSKKS